MIEAPERSLIQRQEALVKANDIRTRRARLKKDLKAGRAQIAKLLVDPPEYMETAKIFDFLMATPRLGRVKVNKIFQTVRMSPSKTFDGITDRQRDAMLVLLIGY